MKPTAAVGAKDAATQEGVQAVDATLAEPSSATTKDAKMVVDATGNSSNDLDS